MARPHLGQEILRRFFYLFFALLLIALGLASRRYLPVETFFLGSIIWAMMVLFFVAALLPSRSRNHIILVTTLFCIFVEVIHLVPLQIIDDVRRTTIGYLVIGKGFSYEDLVWYALGIVIGGAGLRR